MHNTKSKEECIQAICRFPKIYSEQEMSAIEIVKISNYWKYRDNISLEDIIDEVKSDSSIVDSWIQFTEDKRWTPAWGLSHFDGNYTLFYMFRNGNTEIEIKYKSGYDACARLIRLEMEGIRIES